MTMPRPDAAHYAPRSASNELLDSFSASLICRLLREPLRCRVLAKPHPRAQKLFPAAFRLRLAAMTVREVTGSRCTHRYIRKGIDLHAAPQAPSLQVLCSKTAAMIG